MRTRCTLGGGARMHNFRGAVGIAVGTLGYGGVMEAGATLGTVATGMGVLARSRNIRDNVTSVSACSGRKFAKGAYGVGFYRTCTRSCATTMAASADDITGMLLSSRKNSTVRAMRSCRVLVM